jgi:hypothetical protein
MMGRGKEVFRTIKDKLPFINSSETPTKKTPHSIEIYSNITKPAIANVNFSKYGYDTPKGQSPQDELTKRLDSILQEDLKAIVEKAVAFYGRHEVSHLGWRGDVQAFGEWAYNDKKKHSKYRPQDEDVVKLAVAVDFGNRMVEEGKGDQIIKEWIEERDLLLGHGERISSGDAKEPRLSGGLAAEEALKRVGNQDVALIHTVLEKIARGDGEVEDELYNNAKLKMKDYMLPSISRGN